jgi:hypothetical protein
MRGFQTIARVAGLSAALACAGGWFCVPACGGKTVDDDIGATGSSGSGSGSGLSSGTGSGSNSSSGSGSGGGSSSGSSDGSGSGSSGANLADAGPDAQPGDADAEVAEASVDDASEAGTDAGAWVDLSSNPAACVDEPNVPCGWAPTNDGAGYTCACRHGTWADGWTCELPDAAVVPGPTCPADGGP